MEENGLLDALGELLCQGAVNRLPECELDGHEAGHTCLDVSDFESLFRLTEELTRRHGSPRALAVNGSVDPAASDRSGLPLLAPRDGGTIPRGRRSDFGLELLWRE